MPEELDPAMSYCTHLIYGYATISTHDYKMMPLDPNLEMDHGKGNYRTVTNLKLKFPALKILLSVGGGADKEDPKKYNILVPFSFFSRKFFQNNK